MRVAPSCLTFLAIALSLSSLSHAADKVVGPGENADTGSRSVLVPSGVAAGVIDTGSGEVELVGTRVEGKVDTGSGDISLTDSVIGDDLVTSAGRVTLAGASVVEGDLIVRKPKCWGLCWGNDQPTRVVIGASASVVGDIRIEREAELWVHESARIGRVSGAQVKRYSGERP